MIKKLIYALFSDQHRFVRRMKGGKWYEVVNMHIEYGEYHYWCKAMTIPSRPYDFALNKEDWDFNKWFKKVIKVEYNRDIMFCTDEDDYLGYYERGLSPEEAVNAYLAEF